MESAQLTVAERVRRIVFSRKSDWPKSMQSVTEDRITDDWPLFQGLDSMDIDELIMAFEDEFHCHITPADAETLHTVGDAIRYLEEKEKA